MHGNYTATDNNLFQSSSSSPQRELDVFCVLWGQRAPRAAPQPPLPTPTQQRLLEAAGFRNLPELSEETSGLWHNVAALRWAATQPQPEVKAAPPEAYAFAVFKFVGSLELST